MPPADHSARSLWRVSRHSPDLPANPQVTPEQLARILTHGLPDPLTARPAAILRYRLRELVPLPPPPSTAAADDRAPLRECTKCKDPYLGEAGLKCVDCRTKKIPPAAPPVLRRRGRQGRLVTQT